MQLCINIKAPDGNDLFFTLMQDKNQFYESEGFFEVIKNDTYSFFIQHLVIIII